MKKLVIIPTFNEKENIASIIEIVVGFEAEYDVLVVDDGSPDGTAEIVEGLMPKHFGRIFIEKRAGKLGLGTAYIHGFLWALKRNYDLIFEMDADFSHNPNDLDRLYQACKTGGGDVSIGSRYVKGGSIENWPLDRHLYSKGGAFYTKMITCMPVQDPTAGFVCYRKKVLETINLDAIRFVGYAFQIEMKFTAWKLGFKIIEVPIVFVDRQAGLSKMTKGIIKEGIIGVIKIQLQSMKKHYRMQVSH